MARQFDGEDIARHMLVISLQAECQTKEIVDAAASLCHFDGQCKVLRQRSRDCSHWCGMGKIGILDIVNGQFVLVATDVSHKMAIILVSKRPVTIVIVKILCKWSVPSR